MGRAQFALAANRSRSVDQGVADQAADPPFGRMKPAVSPAGSIQPCAICDDERECILAGLDLPAIFAEHGVPLHGTAPERTARCWQSGHDDRQPSVSVNVATGLWNCHGCGASGDAFTFIEQRKHMTFPQAKAFLTERAGVAPGRRRPASIPPEVTDNREAQHAEMMRTYRPEPEPIPAAEVDACILNLWRSEFESIRDFLHKRRGLTDRTIQAARLGLDSRRERVTIPILDAEGVYRNIRCYRPNAPEGTPKMVSWREGYGRNRLYPARPDPEGTVVICEGELDCLAARQTGLNAVTTTAGASRTTTDEGGSVDPGAKWSDDFTSLFAGRDVVLTMDSDRTGREWATYLAGKLTGIARRVVVHDLYPERNDGSDITDFLLAGGDLSAVVAAALAEAPEPANMPAPTSTTEATEPTGTTPTTLPAGVPVYFRTLRELMADQSLLRPPAAIAAYFAWAGRVTLLFAREKIGKSTLAACAAAAVSTGTPFLGTPTAHGRVLWVGVDESKGDQVRRFSELHADPDHLTLLDLQPTPREMLAVVRAKVEQLRPALIVIDTLTTFVSGIVADLFDPAAYTMTLNALVRLARDFDAALVLVHHETKASGEYRDSTSIGAAADMILRMTVVGDPDTSRLRRVTPKGRFTLDAYLAEYDAQHYRLAGDREASLELRVLTFLRQNPGGKSTGDVTEAVGGRKQDVVSTLDHLHRAGHVHDSRLDARAAHCWHLATTEPNLLDPAEAERVRARLESDTTSYTRALDPNRPAVRQSAVTAREASIAADIATDRAEIQRLREADQAASDGPAPDGAVSE
jgi:hypothetical protein